MLEPLLTTASWLAPPIVGAFIGYWTNRIAIFLLFRPLKAKHLGPIPIPLTPGIVPRNRHELASSIGSIVDSEFLSVEVIQQQLDTPAVREDLKNWIREQSPSVWRIIPNWLIGRLITFFTIKLLDLRQVIDLKAMITERIDGLDNEQIERMILGVTGTHLKWINWFGAFLGAIIGCVQLLLKAL